MNESLEVIDPATSILFLGSGFSSGAENILGESLPIGGGLKKKFADALNLDAGRYDLMTLADEFALNKNLSLYSAVYEIFTTTKIQVHQRLILAENWRRVYTTNYDDLVESSFLDAGKAINSYSFEQPKPARLELGAIIHLHGSIRNATEDNVLEQLVLNEESYVRQHVERSVWYDEFVRDLKFCTNCFFIGYSLADMHVAALLMKNKHLRNKIFFITRDLNDDVFNRRVEPYGYVMPIGANGFSDLCKKLPRLPKIANPLYLRAFKYIDPQKDKKTLVAPTAIEILNLVSFGTFNEQRCLSTLPESRYVIARSVAVKEALALLANNKCLLVHSRLGNGKTIFLYILAHSLAEAGYQCYLCKENSEVTHRDLDALAPLRKVALIFDSYDTAMEVIPQCANLENAKFVVAVRTGLQEVRMHEIRSKLPASIGRLSLNVLEPIDKANLKNLLNSSGVRVDGLERDIDKSKDIREVVVSLYRNQAIQKRISSELSLLVSDQKSRMVMVCAHLVKWIGCDLEMGFLRAVTGADPYSLMVSGGEVFVDLLQFDADNVHARSAIFSEYLIKSHFETHWIMDAVYNLIVEAVRRKSERTYRKIVSGLMKYSALEQAVRRDSDGHGALTKLYDRLHRDSFVNNEPLFWLQYAILMIAVDDLGAAELFLSTAYDRAAKTPGFKTYQIDTQSLRYYLMREARDQDAIVVCYDKIYEKLLLVIPMLDDDSHRAHAVAVMKDIEPFVRARVNALSLPQKNELVREIDRILFALARFDNFTQSETASISVSETLARAKRMMLLPC